MCLWTHFLIHQQNCARIIFRGLMVLHVFFSVGEGKSESKITEALEEIFTKLKALSEARKHLKQFG